MNTENYNTFLKLDLSSYIGDWVAICDGKIVSTDGNIKKVYEDAKEKCPNKRPFITKVPEKDSVIF
ncbi:MAG: DUF5678 domain-containing protein [Candidatus Pacearchaeota archaeon]|nr:DUF5678 domain-containing protein [Candidatus Pacearchaeota archaeon]